MITLTHHQSYALEHYRTYNKWPPNEYRLSAHVKKLKQINAISSGKRGIKGSVKIHLNANDYLCKGQEHQPINEKVRNDPDVRHLATTLKTNNLADHTDLTILPVIADAMEAAGCTDVVLLEKLRVGGGEREFPLPPEVPASISRILYDPNMVVQELIDAVNKTGDGRFTSLKQYLRDHYGAIDHIDQAVAFGLYNDDVSAQYKQYYELYRSVAAGAEYYEFIPIRLANRILS